MDTPRRTFMKLGTGAAVLAAAMHQAKAAETPAGGMIAPPPGADMLRLVTFAPDCKAPRVGAVLADGQVVDLGAAAQATGSPLSFDAASMHSLIAAGPQAVAEARHLAASGPRRPLSGQLLAPLPTPTRNIYAVGWNYLEHVSEGAFGKSPELPKHPVFFTKAVGTVNGPYDTIPFDPSVSTMIDWEGELAVIIGKPGRNITEAQAMDHVFGFAVINDTTARDLQMNHGGQWFKGKSLDGHGPIGPWIVPASDIDYNDLRLTTTVNGVLKQDINTSQMYFKVPRLIAELSLGMALEPGDIIATGTPSGVGAASKPPQYLEPGDVLETAIDRIGAIRNVIRAVPA